MNIEKLIRIIPHITNGITEIYAHPATKNIHNNQIAMNNDESEAEYKALIHARTKRTIKKFDIRLSGFNS